MIINQRFFILLSISLVISTGLFAQHSHTEFGQQSLQTQNSAMIILGSWAILNMGTGAYGWSTFDGDKMYFNQMNFFWNTVNLTIAGFALYNNFHTDLFSQPSETILLNHKNTEKILLINSALDLAYIGTGFLLKHFATKNVNRVNILKGYGNSLILQGSFLLVFDAVFYSIMKAQRMEFLAAINVSYFNDAFFLQYAFNF